jgi:hypothetical protein
VVTTTLSSLAILLKPLEGVRGFGGIKYCPRKDIDSLEYPTPKVTLNEIRKHPDNPALCIEWTMLKILGYPGVSECRSELEVERHIGSNLAGIFQIVDCTTTS